MPAIQLARLKIQVTELLVHFDVPADFVRELHGLLNFYADRTRRPGRSGKPKSLLQAYNVPKQVIRRIESDLSPLVLEDPPKALELADQLWADQWFETCLLAAHILGSLPLDPPETIIQRLQAWGKDCRDDALFGVLLEAGAERIRTESPNEFLRLIEGWFSSADTSARKLGLRAMPTLVQNPDFENLPTLFRFLSPILREVSSALETDLLRCIRALAARSPQETAYLLRKNLVAPHKPGLDFITRRSLDVFPPELQSSLRETLRERMRTNNGAS